MPATRTPPHLGEPKLVYATEADAEAYLTAVMRGFHEDYVAEHWELEQKVIEWDRDFGFQVVDRWVATCGAFSRVMTVPGGKVPVAAVTIVTVAAPYRRRGLLNQMMRHQLDDIARRGTEPVALLWASESLIYGRYGYGHAAPRIQVSGATRDMGFLPSIEPAPGSVDEVSKVEFMASAAELRRRLLPDRPGALNRSEAWWDVALYDPESLRNGASAQRFALHFDRSGTVDGYAVFRTKEGDKAEIPGKEVQIGDLDASNSRAYAALWRYVLDLDLVRRFVRRCAPADEPLRYLVADQRAIKTEVLDGTYARIIDVPAALEGRRYHRELDTVVEVHDHMLTANEGAYHLEAGLQGVSVTRTRRKPDVSLSARELGAIYLGGTSLDWLDRAGLVEEHKHGTVSALAAAFSWPRPPFCVDFF